MALEVWRAVRDPSGYSSSNSSTSARRLSNAAIGAGAGAACGRSGAMAACSTPASAWRLWAISTAVRRRGAKHQEMHTAVSTPVTTVSRRSQANGQIAATGPTCSKITMAAE